MTRGRDPAHLERIILAAAAPRIVHLHATHGGCTWSLSRGDLSGTEGYAVGRHTRAVAVYQHAITRAMVLDGWEFLGRPRTFGTWWDADKGRSIMELIVVVPTLEAARHRAAREGSRFVFDLWARRSRSCLPAERRRWSPT